MAKNSRDESRSHQKGTRGNMPEFTLDVLAQPTRLSAPSAPSQLALETAKLPRKKGSYGHDNRGYSGSERSLNRSTTIVIEPVTSVVREQYWTCSKWPRAQLFLAITVAVLLGALIGLAVAFSLKIPKTDTILDSIFRTSSQA